MSIDVIPLTSGRYAGLTPEQIADRDPSYIVSLYDSGVPRKCSKTLMLACLDALDERDEELDIPID